MFLFFIFPDPSTTSISVSVVPFAALIVVVPVTDKDPEIVPPESGSFVESAIVIFCEPSKETPLIVLAVLNLFAHSTSRN